MKLVAGQIVDENRVIDLKVLDAVLKGTTTMPQLLERMDVLGWAQRTGIKLKEDAEEWEDDLPAETKPMPGEDPELDKAQDGEERQMSREVIRLSADRGDGHWVTMNGKHVFVEGGKASPAKSDHAASILDRWATPATGSREGEYEAVRKGGESWAKGETHPDSKGWSDLHKETQNRLKKAGVESVHAYRGIELPENHPLVKAIREGKLKTGSKIKIDGAALSGWSTSKNVAEGFANTATAKAERSIGKRKTVGIVIHREIPREDVVAGHMTHTQFLGGENEVIAKNSGGAVVRIHSVSDPSNAIRLSRESCDGELFDISETDSQRFIQKDSDDREDDNDKA